MTSCRCAVVSVNTYGARGISPTQALTTLSYWYTSSIISTPWSPTVMLRDRFFTIIRFLHLVDSTQQRNLDVILSSKFVHSLIIFQHSRYYQPSCEISIDEKMIGTLCRVVFLQYLRQKPCKFGVKVRVPAEAKPGYVLGFQIYTGTVLPAIPTEERYIPKGLAYRVVMDLMDPYQNKGHRLFMDNFYTSVLLLC